MRALRALERFLYDMESAGILTLDRFQVGSDFDTGNKKKKKKDGMRKKRLKAECVMTKKGAGKVWNGP